MADEDDMLPDTADLIHAFLVPAAGAGVFAWRKGPSDEDLRRKLDGFRRELRVQFDADRERQNVSTAKLEAMANEWAPRVENEEIGVQLADMMKSGIVALLAQFHAERLRDYELLRKVHSDVRAAASKGRPSLIADVQGWIDEGRALADENIETLEALLDRARKVEADFRSMKVEAYLKRPENGSSASFDEQMAVGRRMMGKYRNALRELAK